GGCLRVEGFFARGKRRGKPAIHIAIRYSALRRSQLKDNPDGDESHSFVMHRPSEYDNAEAGRSFKRPYSARLQAGTWLHRRCPSEGGLYTIQCQSNYARVRRKKCPGGPGPGRKSGENVTAKFNVILAS